MSVTPDESRSKRVQATLPAAEDAAAEAWDRLQERGPSFGSHPLSELLEEDQSDSAVDDLAEVA